MSIDTKKMAEIKAAIEVIKQVDALTDELSESDLEEIGGGWSAVQNGCMCMAASPGGPDSVDRTGRDR